MVGLVASRLLEPAQRSGSVVLHDVDIRGRAAAGVRRSVEFDAACERAGEVAVAVAVGGDTQAVIDARSAGRLRPQPLAR